MAGTITRLVYQKRHKQRVNIYLDGEYAFALPDTAAAQLQIGQYLSDEKIATLNQVDAEAKAFDKAMRLLAIRPRTRHEIQRRLAQADYSPAIITSAMARLERLGYIDDTAFVAWWVDNRSRFKPRGMRALQQELRLKGVSYQAIEEALASLDEQALALRAGQERVRRWSRLDQREFEKKMMGFLQRRGFDYGTVRMTVAQLWQQVAAAEE